MHQTQTDRCARCGFDAASLSPGDVVAQLRAVPIEWRRVLAVNLDDDDPLEALTTPDAHGWTALEHAGHTRDVLHALSIRIQRVLRERDPVLPDTHSHPPAGANEQGPAVVLASLTLSAEELALLADSVGAVDWTRTGRRRSGSVRAIDLAAEAVHTSRHHLQLAEQAIGRTPRVAGLNDR